MRNFFTSSQDLSEESLKAFVKSTLNVCVSTESDVPTNLRLLDSAWEAQKQIWTKQELITPKVETKAKHLLLT